MKEEQAPTLQRRRQIEVFLGVELKRLRAAVWRQRRNKKKTWEECVSVTKAVKRRWGQWRVTLERRLQRGAWVAGETRSRGVQILTATGFGKSLGRAVEDARVALDEAEENGWYAVEVYDLLILRAEKRAKESATRLHLRRGDITFAFDGLFARDVQ